MAALSLDDSRMIGAALANGAPVGAKPPTVVLDAAAGKVAEGGEP